jgi:Eco57I restriction-modification methylase/TaqI-like C-terminal specificity domain/N-6 DNA Methylase
MPMSAPREIIDLIDRYSRNADSYRSSQYGETEVRIEFINPFFKCLGWDVDNTQGFAEAYKDVINEDAIRIGGHMKAPDYCFRIGGTRKFFLEAKRPSVNLKTDPEPAYQLRRYAWTAKLPLSILTDFEEFAVYDGRMQPAHTDKASAARIEYLTFSQYPERWDWIAATFSKDAVLKGSFDKYAETSKLKKGTATVDAAFLKEIEGWRELLAKNIALRNENLSQPELNYAVQVTIDRILFLRMCEDRGVEHYGQLGALQNGAAVYGRLKELFRKADERYNSGLFHFTKEHDRAEEPDRLTTAINVDDKPLKDIFKSLYYPDSPYEFSVLPAEILGQVYEQFLGKVIRLTGNHRAIVEEKPEVRKAGGVYYTPTYIVDYIVKNTVGKLLEGKTPKQAAKLKILDPACGSGSFLLGAYQFLLDWYLHQYTEANKIKPVKEIFQGRGGAWYLTSAAKKRILLDNIFGVDIDPQAVEVTKLSLLLKVLEGESQQTLERQLLLFHERALPDLANNIKCGNSLIGPDFYDGQQLTLFDEEERYRINVFDWNAEFPAIMKAGGFDAVIGNPPYIRIGNIEEHLRPFLYEKYEVNHRFDIYVVFVQRAFELLSRDGCLGYILPNKFFTAEYGSTLREYLSSRRAVKKIVDFGDQQVFEGASTYTCLLFLDRTPQSETCYIAATVEKQAMSQPTGGALTVAASGLTAKPWSFQSAAASNLVQRLATFPSIGNHFEFERGLETGADDVFLLHAESSSENDILLVSSGAESTPFEIERAFLRKVVKGAVDVRRYFIEANNRYVLFPYRHEGGEPKALTEDFLKKHFPLAWKYLSRNRATLRERKSDRWFEYRRRNYDLRDDVSRILVPSIGTRPCFAFDDAGAYHFVGSGGGGGGGYGLTLKPEKTTSSLYLLALLNSRLIDWLAKLTNSRFGNGYYSYNRQYVAPLPIRSIDFGNAIEKSRHDTLAGMATQMITLHKRLATAKTPHETKSLETQIAATDRQIDNLVYELYGLTPEEIQVVESAGSEPARAVEESSVEEGTP